MYILSLGLLLWSLIMWASLVNYVFNLHLFTQFYLFITLIIFLNIFVTTILLFIAMRISFIRNRFMFTSSFTNWSFWPFSTWAIISFSWMQICNLIKRNLIWIWFSIFQNFWMRNWCALPFNTIIIQSNLIKKQIMIIQIQII